MMPVHPVILLPGGDRDRQPVFFRRKRTRGVSRHRAGRIVGAIEIQNHFAIHHRIGIQEPSPG